MTTSRIQHLLINFDANHLLRERHVVDSQTHTRAVIKGKSLINFCSNDYLHISTHPDVKKAFIQGALEHGLGSGSSAMVSGYSKSHHLLEEQFAEFLNREKALLFNSGYHANLGVLSTFADRNSVVIADKFCHASLIDGIVLSRAKYFRYRHNDVHQAERLLGQVHKNKLLISESVFSMQGDIAPIKQLSAFALQHNAMFLVDDAHGIGVLGDQGKGICEYYHLSQHEIPCLITPLGKSLGSFGAIVSGRTEIIDALLQLARTYRYSTALPPAICYATLAALKIIRNESWRRKKLQALIRFFIKEAVQREFILTSLDETPIKSILVGSNQITVEIQKNLIRKGFLVSCIRPPTVPKNGARIRISLNCMHNEQQIIQLLDRLKDCYTQIPKKIQKKIQKK
jgi:8-amino-7-oxononanoate synthase